MWVTRYVDGPYEVHPLERINLSKPLKKGSLSQTWKKFQEFLGAWVHNSNVSAKMHDFRHYFTITQLITWNNMKIKILIDFFKECLMWYLGIISLKPLILGNIKTKYSWQKSVIRESIRIYDKRCKISQKVSAIPICRLEWGSQDPPLFPGLLWVRIYFPI